MVGATGVEPARITPKDPKSFASANSATRPTSLGMFAAAGTIVNTFQAEQALAVYVELHIKG
jgi:hypothetical protein